MTARILPKGEWAKLMAMWPMLPQVKTDAMDVVVVEDAAGEIVGCWGLITLAHVEGMWIRDDHQKRGVVLRKLWRAMRDLTLGRNIPRVITGSESVEVTNLLMKTKALALPRQFLLPMSREV